MQLNSNKISMPAAFCNGSHLCYALVRMHRMHMIVSSCVYLCIGMSVTPISQRSLKNQALVNGTTQQHLELNSLRFFECFVQHDLLTLNAIVARSQTPQKTNLQISLQFETWINTTGTANGRETIQ